MSETKHERNTKILEMLNHIKYKLWPVIFGTTASGLESFIADRVSKKTGQPIKEYVVYDINPIYDLPYSKDNFIFKFFGGVL